MTSATSFSWPQELAERANASWSDFLHYFSALYPGAGAVEIQQVHNLLLEAYQQRSADLRELDEQRAAQPSWFQDPRQVGTMFYVDLLAGNLQGVMEHLDYFQELGITYLHLMPLLEPRLGPNDGGYAVANYRQVNPRLGTMAQLHELAQRLHANEQLLVIDLVMNHTAREHAWAQAALAGDAHYEQFFFFFNDRHLPAAYEQTLPEVFPDFAPGNFTFLPERNQWVWTTFYPFQWDLNYANPQVFIAMLGEMLFLANQGIDVLRLDAVPFLWKRMGTNCQNQPEAVWIIAAYRALLRIVAPGVLFKSEAIVAPDDIIKYLGAGGHKGKACEIGYNATLMNHLWHALASENTHLLRTTLAQLSPIPAEATWINYIRCHDDIGWGISDANAAAVGQEGRSTRNFCTDFYAGLLPNSYAEGYVFQRDPRNGEARISGTAAALTGLQQALVEADVTKIELAYQRLALLNGVIFFMRGIPLIYAGDEVGQLNHFGYLLDPEKAGDNRWVHRPPMDWVKAARRHDTSTIEGRLFHLHRQLADLRKNSPALHGRSSDSIVMPDNDHLFICERSYGAEKMLLVANFSRAPQRLTLAGLPPSWRARQFWEAQRQLRLQLSDGVMLVPGYTCFWLQPSLALTTSPPLATVVLEKTVEAAFGEQVYFIGSIPELGAWSLSGALRADGNTYPRWRAEVQIPLGTTFFYKWIRGRNGQIVEWSSEEFLGLAGFEPA